jgi:hypothetical protein
MQQRSFWEGRPKSASAVRWAAVLALLAALVALGATRLSSLSARSHLPLAGGELDEYFLTPLSSDPARLLLTTRRENANWARDQSRQAGDSYWVRRYGDPARPGLMERILLTSRSRGAHLFVPLGALDLERALAAPLEPDAVSEGTPRLRHELARVYWNRSFAGLFLHLRFPERAPGAEPDEEIDQDLVIVRGNELLTTDFLLQPNAQLYRAALTAGRMPPGPLRRNPQCADEIVLLVSADPKRAGVPLFAPLSLFDELRLCWGAALPALVDDRWRPEEAPPYVLAPPSPELRARVRREGAVHLAARFEGGAEREALQTALMRFAKAGG